MIAHGLNPSADQNSIATLNMPDLVKETFEPGAARYICMCLASDDTSATVIDRDPALDKSLDPSGPRIRCPLCGWSPRKDDKGFCTCGGQWNTFDTGGPSLPTPMD